MQERVSFKAYKDNRLVLHTWAAKGTVAETVERDVYQLRLNKGTLDYVEVIEPAEKTTTMIKRR